MCIEWLVCVREREGEREIAHALLCAHRLGLSNHLATAAQKKSAADWQSAELPGCHSLLALLSEWCADCGDRATASC